MTKVTFIKIKSIPEFIFILINIIQNTKYNDKKYFLVFKNIFNKNAENNINMKLNSYFESGTNIII